MQSFQAAEYLSAKPITPRDVLDELGDIQFWKLAIKPGKPFAFGKIGKIPFFGLPGNPRLSDDHLPSIGPTLPFEDGG